MGLGHAPYQRQAQAGAALLAVGGEEAVEDLALIGRRDPGAAVRELDRYPFAFELTQERQGWFAQQGIPGEVADYLEKRAEVDWEALRGDVDPATPAAGR